jgi:hypothetical protein
MYQERKTNIGEVPTANPHGRHRSPDDSTDSSCPGVNLQRLEWVGPHVFKARYGAQLGLDHDFGVWQGTRHDQLISHHRAPADSGLVYAYDLTWDEYAVLATDVPAAAVEAVLNRALTINAHMPAEEFARMLADHLAAPTPDVKTTAEVATGVEL